MASNGERKLAARFPGRLVIVGDPDVIAQRARTRGIPFDVPEYRDAISPGGR